MLLSNSLSNLAAPAQARRGAESRAWFLVQICISLAITACLPCHGLQSAGQQRAEQQRAGQHKARDSTEATNTGAGSPSDYEVDLDRARELWPGLPPIEQLEDLFRTTLDLGGRSFVADTHLFGSRLEIVPFHDDDQIADAEGRRIDRGDGVLADYFPPGDLGFAVRHRRSGHRRLELAGSPSELKDELQLRDGHVEILVGVVRDGRPGVVTVNMPQAYENGRFGNASYPMIFFRPQWPLGLEPEQKGQFLDNVRTYLIGFDSVGRFPISYSGGDPLGASTRRAVEEHAEQMVRAIAGDGDARRWFKQRENLLYCSELAHLATTAGLLLPLNEATFAPRVGREIWRRFTRELEAHNRRKTSAFTELNDNRWIGLIDLALAPESLRPAPELVPELAQPGRELAFRPLTLADLAEQFLQVHLPRERLGEEIAPFQARLLEAIQPALWQVTEIDDLELDDPRRREAETLFTQLVETVERGHGDYKSFRVAVGPLLERAAAVASPRHLVEGPLGSEENNGAGLYVPPSMFHLMAQDRWPAGMVDIEYVGHGMHYSLVRRRPEHAEGR